MRRSRLPLPETLDAALGGDGTALEHLAATLPMHLRDAGEREELIALSLIHDLWLAPARQLGERASLQLHPAAVRIKNRLEERFLTRLDRRSQPLRTRVLAAVTPETATPAASSSARSTADPSSSPLKSSGASRETLAGDEAVAAMRRVAASDMVPEVYRWLAEEADADELVWFLTVEGGPDAGFDDLVALSQVGVRGVPKVALALNYWDELGRGEPDAVHTVMHDRMVDAIGMRRPDPNDLPVGALERAALGGALATNRSRQPECLGALGLLEMQAGPRCRAVVAAMDRLGAPAEARAFYAEHEEADPRHGKDWLDRVVRPMSDEDPRWGARIVRGACWRAEANRRLFDDLGAIVRRGRADVGAPFEGEANCGESWGAVA